MAKVVVDEEQVRIPACVTDLESFRRWAHSDDFPEQGRICFLEGEVWIDMSNEELFTHALVKGEYITVLTILVHAADSGYLFPDGVLLTCLDAAFSSGPDAVFVSNAALED